MKRVITVLSILLTFTFLIAIPAEAQPGKHHGQKDRPGMMAAADSVPGPTMGMMQSGMMQQMQGMHRKMMQNPVHHAMMKSFMLPALSDTLGLSDQQTSQLQALKSEAMKQRQEHREQMMADRKEYMALFEEGQPSPEEVRQHLTEMAESGANQQAVTYETAQQMRQVLSDEQRQLLDGMSPQERMRQMMSTMPMMDMMKMMRSMHGGGMMGGELMQQGGMMQPGGMMQQEGKKNRPGQQKRQNQ